MPSQFKSLLGSIRRKPATAPDGKTDSEASAVPVAEKTSIGYDLTHLGLKNTKTVLTAITTLASGEPLDDKEMLLENGIEMLQSLPLNSGLSKTASDAFVAMLWNDLVCQPSGVYREPRVVRQCFGSTVVIQERFTGHFQDTFGYLAPLEEYY